MATCTRGKYSFVWTDLHLEKERTDPLRYSYDVLGSSAIKILHEINREKNKDSTNAAPGTKFDAYTTFKENHSRNATLNTLWEQVNTVPDWVDWAQLARGQKFFYRYAVANIVGFALQGFVGENSAASGVVEVLVRTGGFSTRRLLRRLIETFQFLLLVTKDLESIKPGGAGHVASVRVRLLHSAVRERILALRENKPDYFDVQKFGVPVNTLDSIHSISTFCCNHMWLQLPFMGIRPTDEEIADYIALFRYIGYLLATPDQFFSSVAQAKATMESMLFNELAVTSTSVTVGHNFVECIKDLPPFNISAGFIEAGSRVLNGDDLCDSLGLGVPGYFSYACFTGHCWFVRFLCCVQRTVPGADKLVTDGFRRLLHSSIIRNGSSIVRPTEFAFSYIPQIGKLVQKEKGSHAHGKTTIMIRPIETFYFSVYVLGLGLILAILSVFAKTSLRLLLGL